MLDALVDALTEYVSREDTKRVLGDRIVRPCLEFINEKSWWAVRTFQAMAILVVLQTILTTVVIILLLRRR